MKIFITFLLIFSLIYEGITLSDGKVDKCDEIILQEYKNINPTTCSSNFAIISSTSQYTTNEPIHITIRSNVLDSTFIGIHLLAQDDKNTYVGNWKTTDSLLDSTSCGSLMHNSKIKKTSVDAVWHPLSNINGQITIKAIIIENDNTIYVDCYNIILTPRVSSIHDPPPNTTSTTSTIVTTTTMTTQTVSLMTTTTKEATTTTETTTVTQTTTTSLPTTTTPSGNTTLTPSPTADVSVNVTWIFDKEHNVTSVYMTINNLQAAGWAAIGLGIEQAMGPAHVFMCKRFADNTVAIQRYINPGDHNHPVPAGSEHGGTLTPIQQEYNAGVVSCQFNLSNFNSETVTQLNAVDPLTPSTDYYPLFAIGLLNISTNEPRKHASDSRTALSNTVQLDKNEIILYKVKTPDTGDTLKYVRVHGIIMVFTWILLASTGILIARYFKSSWTSTLICGKAPWFAGHRFLMSLVACLTVLGFLFIFVFNQGAWVDKSDGKHQYAHSITGAIVLSLAFFQPIIALFRCDPDSRYRLVFNLIHGFVGFVSFILAITTLFLASYFHIFKTNTARIIMIIWVIWIGLIFSAMEFLERAIRKKYGESSYTNINASNRTIGEIVDKTSSITLIPTQETTTEQKVKNALLALHILLAIVLSSILAKLIA